MCNSNLCLYTTFILCIAVSPALSEDVEINSTEFYTLSTDLSLGRNLSILASNTSIQRLMLHLLSRNHKLEYQLKFSDKQAVFIIGEDNSIIECGNEPAGLEFENVSSVSILNIKAHGCGGTCIYYFSDRKNQFIEFSSGIVIKNSIAISIYNTSVINSKGLGLAILESSASMDIIDCTFEYGHINESHAQNGGGGVYIELNCDSERESCANSSITIKHGTFRNNSAYAEDDTFISLGNGGGLNIHMKGNTSNISLIIEDCVFEHNNARYWGGGLNIAISNSSQSNTISVKHCTFEYNFCRWKGGGGADIGYLLHSNEILLRFNKIKFMNCSFNGNNASFGGGMLIYSSQAEASKLIDSNEIEFTDCSWKNNRGRYGSALYLLPHIFSTFNSKGKLPRITLDNCTFEKNEIVSFTEIVKNQPKYRKYRRGKGSLFSVGFEITFKSNMSFAANSGTALYLVSSIATMKTGTMMIFNSDTGFYGGAIGLFGSSKLQLEENVDLSFEGNTATVEGGALYQQQVEGLKNIYLQNCFIYYPNPHQGDANITFTLGKNICVDSECEPDENKLNTCENDPNTHDNEPDSHVDSFFIYSIKSCEHIINFGNGNQTKESSRRKPISFIFKNNASEKVRAEDLEFKVKKNLIEPMAITPGNITELPIAVVNYYDQEVVRVYRVRLTTKHSNVAIDLAYVNNYNNKIQLYGRPGDKGNLSLSLSCVGSNETLIPFIMQECPPGYVFDETIQDRKGTCVCSGYTAENKYKGISYCNQTTFQGKLKRGYWMGYKRENSSVKYGKENDLVSAMCPRRYCNTSTQLEFHLPNTSLILEIDDLVCRTGRTGILCAECMENHSAFFHSENFDCNPNKHCNLGWLFFIISEIFPVTILFVLIIMFDIKLTSGTVQGFILYAQIFDTLHISANGQIWHNHSVFYAIRYLKLIFNIFNLNSFKHYHLSFCLWSTASSLDILTFKYVTIAYSLTLVFLTVTILHYCKSNIFLKCFRKMRRTRHKISDSIIHGLSGFLVICYSQCTKTTLLILTPVNLYSKGPKFNQTVVFYDGRLEFLTGRHLIYVIPALVFLLTLVLLPPIVFLTYPLCYRVFSLFRIQESSISKFLCKIVPLEKFKPFFDSFQSSFKDEYRYFSGLYFMYRLSALVTFAFFHSLSNFYTLVEIQFLLMLTAHAWFQPYRNQWHNRLDTFIFATLSIVNSLTLYNYNIQVCNLSESSNGNTVQKVQITIAYLPLLYMVVLIIATIVARLKKCYKVRHQVATEEIELDVSLLMTNRQKFNEEENVIDGQLSSSYKLDSY